MRWRNWSGSQSCRPTAYHEPETEEQIRQVVADATGTIRVAGSGHSFPPLVPSDDTLLSLANYTGIVTVDPDAETATVRAGTTIRQCNRALAAHGLALRNMGDVDRQTLAGALATGTHGTGQSFGVLATDVDRLRLVTADGTVRELSPDNGAPFHAAQVSLGALGVITELTLNVRPAYRLREVKRPMPLEEALDRWPNLLSDHRHAEFWWFPHADIALVKTLDETDDPLNPRSSLEERLENLAWGALCRVGSSIPLLAPACNRLAGASVLPESQIAASHEVFPTERSVRFEEMEYGVPTGAGPAALRELTAVAEAHRIQFPIEFRHVAGDSIPLSPAHGRDTEFLAVHTYHRRNHEAYFEASEQVFRKHDGRPHWGKRHSLTAAQLAERYPKWEQFLDLRRDFDPDGLFTNEHLRRVLGAS